MAAVQPMSVRESYAERFGAEQADALHAAACEHRNGIHDNEGSDPFKWAVAIAIGFQCVQLYHEHHGITVAWDEFRAWVRDCADLASHDGDVDSLALMAGTYNEFVADAPPC